MTEISSMIISHVKARIEDIEKSWHGDLGNLLKHMYMHELVDECAVLKTCNRVELYVVSPKGSKVLFDFAKKMKVSSEIVEFCDHDESLMHLLRLSSGLESMIVGEDQILGQISDLYHVAQKAGTTGKVLETAFDKAIHVGKRIRTETGINKGSVSIGSAAVDLAEEQIGILPARQFSLSAWVKWALSWLLHYPIVRSMPSMWQIERLSVPKNLQLICAGLRFDMRIWINISNFPMW